MLSILTSCSENDHIYQRLIFYTILERITPDNRGCRGFRQALPRLHPLLKRITRLTGAYYDFPDNTSGKYGRFPIIHRRILHDGTLTFNYVRNFVSVYFNCSTNVRNSENWKTRWLLPLNICKRVLCDCE